MFNMGVNPLMAAATAAAAVVRGMEVMGTMVVAVQVRWWLVALRSSRGGLSTLINGAWQ
jgi:hypothetical protein